MLLIKCYAKNAIFSSNLTNSLMGHGRKALQCPSSHVTIPFDHFLPLHILLKNHAEIFLKT